MKKLRITVDGKVYDVDVEILQDDENQILPSYYQQPNVTPVVSNQPIATPTPTTPVAKRPVTNVSNNSNQIFSPINGVVIDIPVKVGQKVNVNDTVVVLEAMKMKTNISSSASGEIESIEIKIGDTIEAGTVLITLKEGK